MDDLLFKNRYRIPSARAWFHDYGGGVYFVTICTRHREHLLGKIVDDAGDARRDVPWRAGRDVPWRVSTGGNADCAMMRDIANMQSWLAVAIGGFKSAVTRHAHENDIDFGWQSRFHDHIIRDGGEYNAISGYIGSNVARWKQDCFYP